MPDEATDRKKPEFNTPKVDMYAAFNEGLKEYDPDLKPEDVEMALGGFLEGLEWLSERTGVDITSFNLGVSSGLGHRGAAALFISDSKSVVFSPGFFAIAKEARQAAAPDSFPIDEIQVDLTILPGFPVITLPFRDVFRLEGIAEGVHLIQRMVGLGETTIKGFEPMRDSDMSSMRVNEDVHITSATNTGEYVRDKFEIEEKTWVYRYFQEKYGNNNPYADFFNAFKKAGE